MNKFDDMMRVLFQGTSGFSHLVVADACFEVFHRAWCVAEIVESNSSGMPQQIKLKSIAALDQCYDRLMHLDVRECRASRPEDRDMILANIRDVEAFNLHSQCAIFGTRGLFGKWLDGRERGSLVGRVVKRARGAALTRRRQLALRSEKRGDKEGGDIGESANSQ